MTSRNQLNLELFDEDSATPIDTGTGVEEEEIEAGDIGSDESITEPFNPALIRIDTKQMTIDLLLSRIKHHELDLTPTFQRQSGIWKLEDRSRLIESLLIRIPLPSFYLDATNDEKWLVVDGQQRLMSLKEFVIEKDDKKKLKLRGLEFLKHLENKTYDELPRNLQRRILETQVTVYLIEEGTPSKVKFNIFKRINTGGLPLSLQEIRHALNQGKATEMLARLAASDEFRAAIDKSIRDNRMADRECILRFLAFTITPYTDYKVKDFDSFLNDRMADINKMSDQKIQDLKRQFLRVMVLAIELFGKHAFRKRYQVEASRYPISKALFEVWSVNLNKLSAEQALLLKQRKVNLNKKFIELMNSREFDNAVSQSTGDVSKVRRRFSAIEQLIKDVLS